MMMSKSRWDNMKGKQIYFVEYNDTIIKFKGYDDLERWIDELESNEKYIVYFVNCVMAMTIK